MKAHSHVEQETCRFIHTVMKKIKKGDNAKYEPKIHPIYHLRSKLGLHDISHAILNAHLVSKAGPVISGNFHNVHDFTWSSIYHTKPLFTDKLCKSRLIMNMV